MTRFEYGSQAFQFSSVQPYDTEKFKREKSSKMFHQFGMQIGFDQNSKDSLHSSMPIKRQLRIYLDRMELFKLSELQFRLDLNIWRFTQFEISHKKIGPVCRYYLLPIGYWLLEIGYELCPLCPRSMRIYPGKWEHVLNFFYSIQFSTIRYRILFYINPLIFFFTFVHFVSFNLFFHSFIMFRSLNWPIEHVHVLLVTKKFYSTRYKWAISKLVVLCLLCSVLLRKCFLLTFPIFMFVVPDPSYYSECERVWASEWMMSHSMKGLLSWWSFFSKSSRVLNIFIWKDFTR